MFYSLEDEKKYLKSLEMNLGKDEEKVKWANEAKDKSIEFLCKDAFISNNAWYRFNCGHIASINRADVRRNKFCCRICKFKNKYIEKCKEKNLMYLTHYCENEQTMIKAKCLSCNDILTLRASSITHHKSIECRKCKINKWTEQANKCGLIFIEQIDSIFAKYKCLKCNKEQIKRFSDISKQEAVCECIIREKNEIILQAIMADAERNQFKLIKKLDSTWCLYECMICGNKEKYQFQAMKIGNVRCRSVHCNENKSRGQQIIENYLSNMLNFIKLKNEITFDDLIGLGGAKLRFDIGGYKNDELMFLIEFDGIHHEKPISYFNTVEDWSNAQERFKIQQIHDKMKDEYTQSKNIPFLRISYKEFNKGIWENKLNNFINSIK